MNNISFYDGLTQMRDHLSENSKKEQQYILLLFLSSFDVMVYLLMNHTFA